MNSLINHPPNKLDSSFVQNHRDITMFENLNIPNKNSKTAIERHRDSLSTLLTSLDDAGTDCTDNFIKEEIGYNDLGSLTRKDLELLGVKDEHHQDELLQTFKAFPKQAPSYEKIIKSTSSKNFNKQIMERATSHLGGMRSALAAANLKLQCRPSRDMIVGDKNFASTFVVQALDELKRVTEEIDERLEDLESVVNGNENDGNETRIYKMSAVLMAIIGVAIGFFVLKSR